MKISIIGYNDFIKKNIIENLKNIRDGKNRTRTRLSISEIAEDMTGDVVIVLPSGNDKIEPERIEAGLIIYVFENDDYVLHKQTIRNAENGILVYRCPSITGKWDSSSSIIPELCRCVANDVECPTTDLGDIVEVVFVEDLIEELLDAIEGHPHRCNFPRAGEQSSDPTAAYDGKTPVESEDGEYCYCSGIHRVTVGDIVDSLQSFDKLNSSLTVQDIPQGSFQYKLYSMYLSYLPQRKMSYPVHMNRDNRGVFTELIRTQNSGQVSINIAKPGVTRGQHWHNTKWEIFMVVSGHGLIQEREIGTDKVYSFEVRGEDMRAVIMLPGYTHSITNLEKDKDLVTVMYANEKFNPEKPDTYFEEVVRIVE